MLGSIKDALRQLAQQGDAYTLSKNNNTEQIPPPFLLAVNVEDTRHRYGPELSAPKLNHTHVLSREIILMTIRLEKSHGWLLSFVNGLWITRRSTERWRKAGAFDL
ncbi:hypothetical protein IG631_06178 [Alternaria alternata]|nr:hypothetical protein IG631_06178 [Alternaria alternata]